MTSTEPPRIRPARLDDFVAVMRLLDAAVLEADAGVVKQRIDAGGDTVLVAVADSGTGRVVGALVLDDAHIDAIAVQKERRGRGIGRALVAAAVERLDSDLTADFDADVRPFYEALGFTIERRDGRLWGVRRGR